MKEEKIIYKDLSYKLNGILFAVQNELGRFCREVQYGNLLAKKLTENGLKFIRECRVGDSGNIADFVVEDKIVIELKTKPAILKDDYYQMQRYLRALDIKLGLLVNFRSRYLKPIRVIKLENKQDFNS